MDEFETKLEVLLNELINIKEIIKNLSSNVEENKLNLDNKLEILNNKLDDNTLNNNNKFDELKIILLIIILLHLIQEKALSLQQLSSCQMNC
jgi:hypothetical protein